MAISSLRTAPKRNSGAVPRPCRYGKGLAPGTTGPLRQEGDPPARRPPSHAYAGAHPGQGTGENAKATLTHGKKRPPAYRGMAPSGPDPAAPPDGKPVTLYTA